MFLLKREYFNKTLIIKGLYLAILCSAFLYLSYFEFYNKFVHTLIALLAFYYLLKMERTALFYGGFFTGIFWFYWIAYSFVYYELSFLIPLVILGIGIFYGLFFLAISIFNRPLYRAIALMLISYVAPFGFNWFKLELLFSHTYFDMNKTTLLLLLISTLIFIQRRYMAYALAVFLCFIVSYITPTPNSNFTKLDMEFANFNMEQSYKWERKNLNAIVKQNLQAIQNAIAQNKEVIVLPETTFPLLLNKDERLMSYLKELSKKIVIVAGSLYQHGKQYSNTTYLFQNAEVQIAHKVVLVPFGEAVPFPEKIRNFINNVFYDGAQDYAKASKPTDFIIKKEQFRNAICYEATTDEIYQNLNGVKQVIVTSNNAWFTPSIEPTLQKELLRYYSKKYGVTIYHVANRSDNAIIHPNME